MTKKEFNQGLKEIHETYLERMASCKENETFKKSQIELQYQIDSRKYIEDAVGKFDEITDTFEGKSPGEINAIFWGLGIEVPSGFEIENKLLNPINNIKDLKNIGIKNHIL